MDSAAEAAVRKSLASIDRDLVDAIIQDATYLEVEEGQELLRTGQYVKVIPLVLNGLIKVYTRHEEKELLLYYIQPSESCVMSFTSALENAPSEVFAITEEPTSVVLIPADKLRSWTNDYPDLNRLFFGLFNARYGDLIDTINHLLYHKMDARILLFLQERREVTGQSLINLSHRVIAHELGTAREVVSRVLKKLEAEDKVRQLEGGIEIL